MALLRGVSHAELLATTDAGEIDLYRALDTIDPLFLGDRIDRAAAVIAHTVFTMLRSGDGDAMTVADFVPDYTAWIERSIEEVSDELDAWLAEQQRKGLIEG